MLFYEISRSKETNIPPGPCKEIGPCYCVSTWSGLYKFHQTLLGKENNIILTLYSTCTVITNPLRVFDLKKRGCWSIPGLVNLANINRLSDKTLNRGSL